MSIADVVLKKVRQGPWLDYPGNIGGGIVICGGGVYAPSTYVAIRHLRKRGCQLPIQVWSISKDESPPEFKTLLERIGVEVKYAEDYAQGYKVLRGYESKLIALMNCRWRHVFLMDADNVALVDPTYLFDSDPYEKFGQIFWPDQYFSNDSPWSIKPRAFKDFRIKYKPGLELESGQLFIDREQWWKELQITEILNQHSPEVYRNYTWGDKDTFLIAWKVLGRPFYVIPTRPTFRHWCGPIIYQHGIKGEPIFQHQRKFLYSPVVMNQQMNSEEKFRQDSLEFLTEYYEHVPWKGPFRRPVFEPEKRDNIREVQTW